jgi:hypothetical protein
LGVGAGQWEEKGAGGEEEAGRMVRMDSHHLKLYSEYWTTLSGDGEGRVLGSAGGREADFSTALRSVEMTVF